MSANVLLGKLDKVRRRLRVVDAARGLFRSVAILVGAVAVWFLLDWLVVSQSVQPGTLDLAIRGLMTAIVAAILFESLRRGSWRPLRRKRVDDEIALAVERAHPDLRDRLISTIQLTRRDSPGGSAELVAALEEQTLATTKAMPFTDVVVMRPLAKAFLAMLLALGAAAGLIAWRGDYALALFDRLLLGSAQYPTATRILAVTPGGKSILGEPFDIEVRLDPAGYLPPEAAVRIRASSGASADLPLAKVGPDESGAVVYRGTLTNPVEDLEYLPVAYDARWNEWQRLEVLQRPAIKALALTYGYPAYLGLADESSPIGDIRAVAGTRVVITAEFNKTVTSAKLQLRTGTDLADPIDMELAPERRAATSAIQVEQNGSYRILLVCEDGFDNGQPIEYLVDALPDRAPSARITALGENSAPQDKVVVPFAKWPIGFEARDDFGVATARFAYHVEDSAAMQQGVHDAPTGDRRVRYLPVLDLSRGQAGDASGSITIDLRQLQAQPGQRITWWIEALDARRPEPNVGASQAYAFEVVDVATLTELLQRGRSAVAETLKTIQDQQKDVRDNVDRIRRDMPQQ